MGGGMGGERFHEKKKEIGASSIKRRGGGTEKQC